MKQPVLLIDVHSYKPPGKAHRQAAGLPLYISAVHKDPQPVFSDGSILLPTNQTLDCCRVLASAESCRVNREETIRLWNALKMYSEDDMDFQRRVFQRSGLAVDGTYLPPALAPRGYATKSMGCRCVTVARPRATWVLGHTDCRGGCLPPPALAK